MHSLIRLPIKLDMVSAQLSEIGLALNAVIFGGEDPTGVTVCIIGVANNTVGCLLWMWCIGPDILPPGHAISCLQSLHAALSPDFFIWVHASDRDAAMLVKICYSVVCIYQIHMLIWCSLSRELLLINTVYTTKLVFTLLNNMNALCSNKRCTYRLTKQYMSGWVWLLKPVAGKFCIISCEYAFYWALLDSWLLRQF